MTSIKLFQDELIIASVAFIIARHYTSTMQIEKKTAMDVPLTRSIKTDTWDIDVTLLNVLSAFGEMFKQQIVNSSPKYCIS